jgi:hypothetical protein
MGRISPRFAAVTNNFARVGALTTNCPDRSKQRSSTQEIRSFRHGGNRRTLINHEIRRTQAPSVMLITASSRHNESSQK